MRFRDHEYKWSKPFSHTRHQWSLRGPMGGVHFHATVSKEYPVSAGLEFHRNFDPDEGRRAADHKDCWLTGGLCWHDGTSLYASEHLWPMVEGWLQVSDHPSIFRLLEREYEGHFSQFQGYRGPERD